MAVDAIKICDTWPHVEASDWPHAPWQASHWPRPRPGVPPCPWYGWPRHDDTGTWHSASQTCHNTSRSATWYKYDGLLMWPIIICSHVMISCGSEISSAGNIRGLHYLMNDPRLEIEWKSWKSWGCEMPIISRILLVCNQPIRVRNYGHRMTNEPMTKCDCLCSS